MNAATAVLAAGLTFVLGWCFRRRWPARRLGAPRHRWGPVPGVARAAALVRRSFALHRVPDPAPLLRFRTAIERGASVVQAFDAVAAGSGPWADGARRLVRRVGAGASVQDSVDAWVAEDRDQSLGLLADALAISTATGGSHVRAVDAVIGAVRERAALQREARALASQAQTSAVVLVLMPVVFAVAIAAFDPRVRTFYVASPLGLVCVGGGTALDVAGAWMMLRLVRSVA